MPITTMQNTLGKKTELGFGAPRASSVTIEETKDRVVASVCQSSGQRSGLEKQPMNKGANLKATEAIGTGSWAPTEPSGQVLTEAGAVSINNKALSASVLTTPAVTACHSVS